MRSISKFIAGGLFGLTLGLTTSAFAVPTFSVVSPAHPGLGETFEVDVTASGVTDLYDYQFDLNFDPTKLQYVNGAIEGPFLATAGPTFFFGGTPSAGSVQFVFDTLLGAGPGASGAGVLASFHFTSLARGGTSLSLSNVFAQDTPGNLINVALTPGQVTVPEPGSVALLAVALAGCVVSVRKKKLSAA